MRIPPFAVRWFADDDGARRTHQSRCQCQRVERGTKASSNRGINGDLPSDQLFDVDAVHRHPLLPPQFANDAIEKISSFCSSVNEHHGKIWSIVRNHQARDATARSKIRHDSLHVNQRIDERPSVLDHLVNRAFPEEANLLGLLQGGPHICVEHTLILAPSTSKRGTSTRRNGLGRSRGAE